MFGSMKPGQPGIEGVQKVVDVTGIELVVGGVTTSGVYAQVDQTSELSAGSIYRVTAYTAAGGTPIVPLITTGRALFTNPAAVYGIV
jgi:hypothetical protein